MHLGEPDRLIGACDGAYRSAGTGVGCRWGRGGVGPAHVRTVAVSRNIELSHLGSSTCHYGCGLPDRLGQWKESAQRHPPSGSLVTEIIWYVLFAAIAITVFSVAAIAFFSHASPISHPPNRGSLLESTVQSHIFGKRCCGRAEQSYNVSNWCGLPEWHRMPKGSHYVADDSAVLTYKT